MTDDLSLSTATNSVVLSAGLIFLAALGLGVVKYRQMTQSDDHIAHPYIDTAHRAALLYSFAAMLIAVFVELSGWPIVVDLIAAFVPIFFFVSSIAIYTFHGLKRDTDNQFLHPAKGTTAFMTALIIGEIGGFAVLLSGFVENQLL